MINDTKIFNRSIIGAFMMINSLIKKVLGGGILNGNLSNLSLHNEKLITKAGRMKSLK